jgi:hypothetical protein
MLTFALVYTCNFSFFLFILDEIKYMNITETGNIVIILIHSLISYLRIVHNIHMWRKCTGMLCMTVLGKA